MASATVRIKILGGSEALKDLQGLKRGLGDVGVASEKAAAKEAAAAQKAAAATKAAAERAAAAQIKAAEKAAAESKKAAERVAAAQAKAAEKAAADAKKGADKGASAQAKAAQRAAKEVAQAAQRTAKDHEQAAKQALAAAQQAAKEEARAADKLAEHWRKVHARSVEYARREAAEKEKLDQKTLESRRKSALQTLGRTGRFIGSATAGVLAGGLAAVGTARGIAGVDDVATRVQKANDFRERLIITAGQANLDKAGRQHVQDQVLSAARVSGKAPEELVGVLESGQAKFNDLKFFADNLEKIAVAAKATGSDTGELAESMGFMRQAFGLTGEETMQAMNLMIAAAAKGSIEVKDFARDFAPVMGLFAQGTGAHGIAGVREFLGTSQATGSLGKGSSETATMVARLVAVMQNPDRMKELREKTGITVKPGTTVNQFIETLATNKRFSKPSVQAGIFGGDVNANEAITALMQARKRVLGSKRDAFIARTFAGSEGPFKPDALQADENAIDIPTVAGVDASEGEKQVSEIMASFEDSGLLELQRQAVEMQSHTIEHLKEYNDQILAVVKVSNSLEKSFGTLSLWASSIGTGGITSAGTAILGSLVGGAAGGSAAAATAAGAGGAGTAAGLLATGGTALGALGAGTIAAGVLLAGGVGAGVGYGIDHGFGFAKTPLHDKLGNWWSSDVDEQRQRALDRTVEPHRTTTGASAPQKAQVDMSIQVDVSDSRVQVRQTSRARGGNVNVSAGPSLPGMGQ